ncbi:universal stress protein [Plectonema cf. radiosum LEGE 06105]|uniref:Universal stress protein n=1 Tax=Plectonema cf. radiosum LEGE 06105 TaxID=945769 RepID=A0A8J7FA12_9CYAN|nr:universal stress protein [Plectonema radiosum]MBE9212393.1 universal stress protein [Plectonema cf. radiosum LEGE 06105]
MFNRILVAIDNSVQSQQVLDEAVSLAKVTDGHLMLLHVLSPFDEQYTDPLFLQPTILYPQLQPNNSKYANDWENLKNKRLEWLRSLGEEVSKLGVETEFSQNIGEPSQMICDMARNWEADVIVIGRRGRRGISELLLGSVSNYVLHHAPCSVLTVQGIIDHPDETPSTAKVQATSRS